MRILLALLCLLPVSAYAGAEDKIRDACIARAGKKVTEPQRVCACIAKKHVESAQAKPMLKSAAEQLEWLARFYGEKDKKKAQAMVDKNHELAAFDNLVAEDCMAPAGGGYASPLESK